MTNSVKTSPYYKLIVMIFLSVFTVACVVQPEPFKERKNQITTDRISSINASALFPNLSTPDILIYQDELSELYRLSDHYPIWFNNSELLPLADAAIRILENASTTGLNPQDYEADKLRKLWERFNETNDISYAELTGFDTALSAGILRYLYELHYGRVNAQTLNFSFETKKEQHIPGIAELIIQSTRNNSLNEIIIELEPDLALYRNLKKTLSKYRQLSSDLYFPFFSLSLSLHPGESDAQILHVRHFLTAVGDYHRSLADYSIISESEKLIYDDELAIAVKKFQRRHGLNADGIIGKKTLAALNVPLEQKVIQLELAMERLRWLPKLNNGQFIAVNIPAFQLWAFDSHNPEGKYSLRMKVVVGESLDKQTPVFMANMRYLDFRPYWNIPYSIAVKEILPKMGKNPEKYLYSHNMEFVHRFDNQATPVDFNDDSLDLLRKGRLKLRQRPGKSNALGKVKFIFPNSNAIYLHDTPAHRLFSRSRRDFSHGCIRVEDPESLATFALKSQPEWGLKTIRAAMNSGDTQRIHLTNSIPVIIFYTTAIADLNGTVSFFEDIYGHDEILSKALANRTL